MECEWCGWPRLNIGVSEVCLCVRVKALRRAWPLSIHSDIVMVEDLFTQRVGHPSFPRSIHPLRLNPSDWTLPLSHLCSNGCSSRNSQYAQHCTLASSSLFIQIFYILSIHSVCQVLCVEGSKQVTEFNVPMRQDDVNGCERGVDDICVHVTGLSGVRNAYSKQWLTLLKYG